jgi:hypothetical protein
MAKKDELVDRQSGLTVISALDFLREKAYSSFEEIFYDFEEKTGGIVTVQTASKIAVEIVTGIISPIASQIDPLHVGDAARSLRIAEQYGFRLAQNSKSIQPAGLLRLLTGYASHGFVIDRREATTIFGHVREPSANELELSEVLGPKSKRPANPRPTLNQVFEFLSDEVQPRVRSAPWKRKCDLSPKATPLNKFRDSACANSFERRKERFNWTWPEAAIRGAENPGEEPRRPIRPKGKRPDR